VRFVLLFGEQSSTHAILAEPGVLSAAVVGDDPRVSVGGGDGVLRRREAVLDGDDEDVGLGPRAKKLLK
jgi:hypothetical protein